MTPWHVAIPSYRRPATVARATLPLLLNRGVPADRVTVYCTADDADAYAYITGEYGVRLEPSAPLGMAAARNHCAAAYPPGTRLLFADDDLSDLQLRVDARTLAPVDDIAELVDNGFGLAGAGLWGVYPVLNPFFMRARVNRALTFIVGCFYGTTLTGTDADVVDLDEKEDILRTLKHYVRDGHVTRLEWVAPKTRYYTEPGGMQAQLPGGRRDLSAASCAELLRRYPDLCRPSARRKDGRAELTLRDRRPVPA